MQSGRHSRRGASRPSLVDRSNQPSETIVLEGLADYDKAMGEIDAIIAQLEDGQHSLDEEIRLYERAMRLAHACDQVLQSAELRVETLRSDLSAEVASFTLEDFETEE